MSAPSRRPASVRSTSCCGSGHRYDYGLADLDRLHAHRLGRQGVAMLRISRAALGITIAALVPALGLAQGNDMARPVANGGVTAPGWTGAVDPKEATSGLTL